MSTETRLVNIETNQYNRGALTGCFALKDLSNTNTLTNIILSLPVRTKFSQTDNVITMVKGSTVTIPEGISEQHTNRTIYKHFPTNVEFTIPADTILDGPNNYRYLIYDTVDERLDWASSAYLGTNPYPLTIDIVNNKITSYDDHQVSLPLGYIDKNKVFHPFTSIGFYDNKVWVDRGVNTVIPAGRTDGYMLNPYNRSYTELLFTALEEYPIVDGTLLLDSKGVFSVVQSVLFSEEFVAPTGNNLLYCSNDNYIYDSGKYVKNLCKIGVVNIGEDSLVKSITNLNTYKLVSYNDIKDAINGQAEATLEALRQQLDAARE